MVKLPINMLAAAFSATNAVLVLCNILFFSYGLYNFILCIAGFFPMRRYAPTDKVFRFAAIISARNEEQVLPYLLRSIRQADYPAEQLDIIVIADNCTDSTADVARREGAIVLTREDKVHVGKGHALHWAFERIMAWQKTYDAFCIFDADNLVHPQFFAEMNRAYAAGGRLAQGYRNSKNAEDSWIAASHSFFYWLQNRFFNHARSALGLSASINGTGFMIAADLIREKGWSTKTITEDIETTVMNVLDGTRTWWVSRAIVYDEQPLTFAQSWRQRNRWSIGNWQCFKLYGPQLLDQFRRKPSLQLFDTLAFLLPVPLTFMTALWAITQATNGFILSTLPTSMLLASGIAVSSSIVNAGNTVPLAQMPLTPNLGFVGFTSYLMTACSAVLSVHMESKKQFKRLIGGCFMFPLFLFSWFGINLSLFRSAKQPQWAPIAHVRGIHIDSLLETEE